MRCTGGPNWPPARASRMTHTSTGPRSHQRLLYVRNYVANIVQQQLQDYTNRTDNMVFGSISSIQEDGSTAVNPFGEGWRSLSGHTRAREEFTRLRSSLSLVAAFETRSY